MAFDAIYYPYMVDLDTAAIDAVSDHTFDPGAQVIRPMVDGLLDPKLAAVSLINNRFNLTTHACKTALEALNNVEDDPFSGKTLAVADTMTLFLQKATQYSRAGATSHIKCVVDSGLVAPMTMQAGNDAPGTLTLQAVILAGGATWSTSQSLAGTPAMDEMYYAGTCKLNNTPVDGVQSVSVDFALNLQIEREAGSQEAAAAFVGTRTPVLRLVTRDAAVWNTYKHGVAISSATRVCFRAANALTRESTGISFTVAQGIIISEPISGNPMGPTIAIYPSKDAENEMVVMDTAAVL